MNTLIESLRRALREAEMSQNDQARALRAALQDLFPQWYVWVCDVFPDSGLVVFELEPRSGVVAMDPDGDTDGGTYRLAFSLDAAGAVTFSGTAVSVQRRTVYVPEPEAEAAVTEALATLAEAGRVMSAKHQSQLHDALKGLGGLHSATCDMGESCPLAAKPAAEAGIVAVGGDVVPLVEAAVRTDGTAPVKIIAPGWGSSGYYSPELLERDGPAVFTSGTKMYWNHPTTSEEAERPERDLRDLAAELVTDATWQAKGPAGPGLYADAKVFGGYREAVNELAPHIGVSIRALGKARQGEAEGRTGTLIEQLVAAKSVDFVTQAGAGGQVLQLFEAARGRGHTPAQEDAVSEKELTEARAAITALQERAAQQDAELARLRETALLREARDLAVAQLRMADLPDVTKGRLAEALAKNPPVTEGALDRAAFAAAIDEAVKAEAAYLAQVSQTGAIRGMGSAAPDAAAVAVTEAAQTRLASALGRLGGFSESTAKLAAAGR